MKNKILLTAMFACLIINSILPSASDLSTEKSNSEEAALKQDLVDNSNISSQKGKTPEKLAKEVPVQTQVKQETAAHCKPGEKTKEHSQYTNASSQVEREVEAHLNKGKPKPHEAATRSNKYPKMQDVVGDLVLDSASQKDISGTERFCNVISGKSEPEPLNPSQIKKDKKKDPEKGFFAKVQDLYNNAATSVEDFFGNIPGATIFSQYVVNPIKNNTKMALLVTSATVVLIVRSLENKSVEDEEE